MMAVNIENERKYLGNLLKTGNSGQQSWAKQQAQKLGIDLSTPTAAPVTVNPKTVTNTPAPAPTSSYGDLTYEPIQSTGGVAPIGSNIAQSNPYRNIDFNQVLELNKNIMSAKQNYMNDPTGSKTMAEQARSQLGSMGLGEDWIIGNLSQNEAIAKWAEIQQNAKSAASIPTMTASDDLYNKLNEIYNQISNPDASQWDDEREIAKGQADSIVEEQKAAFEKLIRQINDNKELSTREIKDSVMDSEQSIEDRAFQNFISGRQNMSDRGILNSGLAEDQNTRLLLQKQRDMAGVYRDAATRQFGVNSQANRNLEDVQGQMSKLNSEEIASEIFQKMYGEGKGQLSEQAKIFADMLKETLGYDVMNAKDRADNQIDQGELLLDGERVNIEKGKLNLDLIKEDRRYSEKLSEQTGYLYGADGQPILNANGQPISLLNREELEEEIRKNQADEAIDWATLEVRGQELVAQVAQWTESNKLAANRHDLNEREFEAQQKEAQAMLDKAYAEMNLDVDKQKISVLKDRLNDVDSKINAQIKNNLEPSPELKEQYDQILDDINVVMSSASYAPATSTKTGGEAFNELYGEDARNANFNNTTKGVVANALDWTGKDTKYVWGGGRNESDIKKGRFDCSSFTRHVFKQNGVDLGLTTREQRKQGTKVAFEDIRPGDLIFFDTNREDGHVGVWLGDGKWVGAQSKTGVAVVDMNKSDYWKNHFKGHVRRVA